jgi:hypothetical protein
MQEYKEEMVLIGTSTEYYRTVHLHQATTARSGGGGSVRPLFVNHSGVDQSIGGSLRTVLPFDASTTKTCLLP